MDEVFRKLAARIAKVTGSVWTFVLAIVLVVSWLTTGPLFKFSDSWQLAINSTTTVITFLMVFVIQNTQNRDSKIMHLKLDELIKAMKGANLQMMDIEDLPNADLEDLLQKYKQKNERYQKELERRRNQRTKKL